MAVHIVGPNNPLPPVYEDSEDALTLADGDTVILSAGAEIAAYGLAGDAISGGSGTMVMIDGRIVSGAGKAISTHGTIAIGESGSLDGWIIATADETGQNRANVLMNSGQILGYVSESRNTVVSNSGEMIGGIAAFLYSAVSSTLVVNNTGLIRAALDAVDRDAIRGEWMGATTILNRGVIDGNITLGDADDLYDGRGGQLTGEIYLGQGRNFAYGGEGSEQFVLVQAVNRIDGGGGTDTLRFWSSWSWAGQRVDLRIETEQRVDPESLLTVSNVENLIGWSGDDHFTGSDEANRLSGYDGRDTLEGEGGDDVLLGESGNDVLSGGHGDDELWGGFGDDVLNGGDGLNDAAVFSGRLSDYTITTGADGVTTIVDNRGAGGDGTDRLTGIELAVFSDLVFVFGFTVPGQGDPVVPPPSGRPALSPPSALVLKGGKKADKLVGGDGDDVLNGGLGKDKLTGGAGDDAFAFSTKLGKSNVDRILDFAEGDAIRLASKVFKGLRKGELDAEAFRAGKKALETDDRVLYDAKSGAVYYDRDGAGEAYRAVKFAQLKAKTALSADDFLIV